jgi:hypothetical protein
MTPPSDAVLALIDRHLATATPPCDAGGHYDTYAPAAFVVIGSQVLPKAKAARSAYITAWQRLLPTMQAHESGPRLVRETVTATARDEQGLRLALTLIDPDTGSRMPSAWLIEGPVDAPLIRAICPHDGPLPNADTLIARSLAEMGHWGNHFDHPVWPLSPVGVAYARLHGDEPLPLESLPEARFTCQNRGDCCRMGSWSIPVDPNTQRALAATPWERLGLQGPRVGPVTPLPGQTGPTYGIVAGETGNCEAHVDDRCTIHQAMGWQPIHTCQIFPYQFQMAPDAIIVSASFMCHTVGENQGELLHEQEADILTRLRPVRHLLIRLPDHIPLYPEGPTIPWPQYRRLEARILDLLADRSLGALPNRVRIISHGLDTLIAMAQRGETLPADPGTILDGTLPEALPADDKPAHDWFRQLHGGGDWDLPHRRPFDGWKLDAWQRSRSRPIGTDRDDEMATRYLRTLVFRKLGISYLGIAFSWGLAAMAACIWDRHTVHRHLQDGLAIDRELQLDTARRLDHSLMHTPLVSALAEDPVLVRQLCDPRTWLSFVATSG